jgi:hypothetical protein
LAHPVLANFLSEVQQNPPLLWIVAAAALLQFESRCRAATTRERPYVIRRNSDAILETTLV